MAMDPSSLTNRDNIPMTKHDVWINDNYGHVTLLL